MSYDEWERGVPAHVRNDPIWSLRVYRTALYAGELGRRDGQWLRSRPEYAALSDQLVRAAESISANLAEGYSRLGRKDRARFFEYALGSAGYRDTPPYLFSPLMPYDTFASGPVRPRAALRQLTRRASRGARSVGARG